MCGIVGCFDERCKAEEWEARLRRMAGCLSHRGPDGDGVWYDAEVGIGFGHRRLSIIDLSEAGAQPMCSSSGRFVLVYNGEIYNFQELRNELRRKGCSFRGRSDTEVILEAVSEWGIRASLERFNGMFAFALWDRQARRLHLARDRMGIKPLYYGRVGSAFVFGSELGSFRSLKAFNNGIDREALVSYLRYNYVPAPQAIYEGVHKLPPGCVLSLNPAHARTNGSLPEPASYWSLEEVSRRGQADPFRGSDDEAVQALDALLRDAVGRRMIADVPLGAFLSGGIDSSTVVALMQAQHSQPVKTFSIGFHEEVYNEATHAKAVAEHLGTDHTELYVKPQEAREVIPKLPRLYDEPFADASQIPTYLVSQLARQHVTVSLSGDGGDELFGGYKLYSAGHDLWSKMRYFPRWARSGFGAVLQGTPDVVWNRAFGWLAPILERYTHPGAVADKLNKAGALLGARDREQLYQHLRSQWKRPAALVRRGAPPVEPRDSGAASLSHYMHYMMYEDARNYLTNNNLTKVDRASMGVSLEARVPLLDHRVIAFAWRLPLSLKVRQRTGKWVLRQVLYRYVPKPLMDRPKMGFEVPIGPWLRGPLRDWAEDLLSASRLRREGYLNPDPIRQKWDQHCSGQADWKYQLWGVLMFQAWLEETV